MRTILQLFFVGLAILVAKCIGDEPLTEVAPARQRKPISDTQRPEVISDFASSEELGFFRPFIGDIMALSSDEWRPARFSLLRTPPLRFPDGKILGRDGMDFDIQATPFRLKVAGGEFPVEVLIAHYPAKHSSTGYMDLPQMAAVLVSSKPVSRWKPEGRCIASDSGTVGLIAQAAVEEFSDYFDAISESDFTNGSYTVANGELDLVRLTSENPVLGLRGQSGDGVIFGQGDDGCYNLTLGLARDGSVAALLVDFTGVVEKYEK